MDRRRNQRRRRRNQPARRRPRIRRQVQRRWRHNRFNDRLAVPRLRLRLRQFADVRPIPRLINRTAAVDFAVRNVRSIQNILDEARALNIPVIHNATLTQLTYGLELEREDQQNNEANAAADANTPEIICAMRMFVERPSDPGAWGDGWHRNNMVVAQVTPSPDSEESDESDESSSTDDDDDNSQDGNNGRSNMDRDGDDHDGNDGGNVLELEGPVMFLN